MKIDIPQFSAINLNSAQFFLKKLECSDTRKFGFVSQV